jgi:hypothetical protein
VPTFTAETLVDVHMLSSTDGIILGWADPQQGGSVYRWNGTNWSLFYATPTDPNRIDDLGPNSLWISGQSAIYHYNGAQWSTPYTDTRNIFSIQMYTTGQGPGGWAVGANQLIVGLSNGTWTVVDPSPAPQTLYHSSFTSPTDGWATGFAITRTYILHWNGVQWSHDFTLPDIYIDRLGMISPTLGWGTSSVNDSVGKIYRFNGSTWTEDFQASQGLRNIYMLSATEGWAVGEQGVMVHYYDDATPTPTATVPPSTPTSPAPTSTPGGGATATPTTCTLSFIDVPTNHTFYPNIRCLACRGVISGYSDGTFRPGNNITRGQISKMVSNAAGFQEPVSGQTYEDVPPSHTFYPEIMRLSGRGVMSGYPCGNPEPCVPPDNRPYFRPGNNATRGQLSKIVANAAQISDPVSGQFYEDVPPSHTFYLEIMRLTGRGVMSGYACGGVGEPCVPPNNRPYFRPGNDVTRGQASKIVANTFFPGCQTPQR